MTWRDIYCSASIQAGQEKRLSMKARLDPTGHFLWNPGDFLNDEGVTSVRELRAAVMEWVRFIMSLPTAPPRRRGGSMAAPIPQRRAVPCRAASTTAAAVALFDYGRLWGSFSKGSLRNEGGICSTVVKTVGSLQFCNERDAKGKGSVLLRPEPIESDFAPTTVHLPPLFLMLNSSISPLYQFELEFA